jgi:hypothetical protein
MKTSMFRDLLVATSHPIRFFHTIHTVEIANGVRLRQHETRKAIGKDVGRMVKVHLEERL